MCQSDGRGRDRLLEAPGHQPRSARRRPPAGRPSARSSAARGSRSAIRRASVYVGVTISGAPVVMRQERRTGGDRAPASEHLDLDAAAGEVAVRDERDHPVRPPSAAASLRPTFGSDSPTTSIPIALRCSTKSSYSRRGCELLGHRQRRQADRLHPSTGGVPVPEMGQRADAALAGLDRVVQPVLRVAVDPRDDVLVAQLRQVERIDQVPRVELERLAGRRAHERVVRRPSQHLRLVRGHGRRSAGQQTGTTAAQPNRERAGPSSPAGVADRAEPYASTNARSRGRLDRLASAGSSRRTADSRALLLGDLAGPDQRRPAPRSRTATHTVQLSHPNASPAHDERVADPSGDVALLDAVAQRGSARTDVGREEARAERDQRRHRDVGRGDRGPSRRSTPRITPSHARSSSSSSIRSVGPPRRGSRDGLRPGAGRRRRRRRRRRPRVRRATMSAPRGDHDSAAPTSERRVRAVAGWLASNRP